VTAITGPDRPSAPASAQAGPGALTVTGISWERIHLTVLLRLSPAPGAGPQTAPPDVSFVFTDGSRSFDVASTAEGDGVFAVHVNVTTFADRAAIPNGTWRIQTLRNGAPGPVASYDSADLLALDEASRVFLYDGNRSALTASFGVAENPDHPSRLDLLIHTNHLHRASAATSGRSPVARAKAVLSRAHVKQRFVRTMYRLFSRLIGPKPGRILFASDQQPTMEGNLLRVHERMVERGLDTQFDLRFSFRLPGTTGWATTARILYLMATSEIILLDDYFGLLNSVTVDRRTRIIQVWHAGVGFKSVGYSRFGSIDSPKLSQPHRQYTYAICGSEQLRHVYAEAFGIEEAAVIPTGLPRIDWFLDEQRTRSSTEAFYAAHPQLRDRRIILFAPTFRGSSYHTAFYDESLLDLDELYAACPDGTVVLFRMHHFVKQPISIPEKYRDRFIDVTRYPDGLGLLHVTDLLITDYSSIIYEFALLDRPMLFFAPDKEIYAATRGFHRAYEEAAPGRVCETFAEVVEAIREGDFEESKLARFRAENFDRIDTGAADRVIDWLILGEPWQGAEGDRPAPRHAAPDPTTATKAEER
jgi:CDP-ribitol ribitolphosphotransferase